MLVQNLSEMSKIERTIGAILGFSEKRPKDAVVRAGLVGEYVSASGALQIIETGGKTLEVIELTSLAPGCSARGEGVTDLGKRSPPVALTGTVYSRTRPGAVASVTIIRR